ncbi:AAA family ATPase [Corallococcus exiguus]|uniref:AAA family ATPase n=1 Tax=Corallococcus TaxID=83461 RepID=UPI000F88F696|nr:MULTISPECIES: AAA family ATPase [Corallococcus]NRD55681.1 AAA family ATPase [Corallococcus exiguus]NRD67190.1 AAA family ATPase [Corallococcus exiguus]RUO92890.1 ATP-dependent endonuclease [Corallococcus sp. AB018]
MHIQHVEIGNFRKLQAVRIDFSEETTVFVGANNSGKTSAMVALRHFLVDRTEFSVNDFTLSHWTLLDAAAAAWEKPVPGVNEQAFDWGLVLPHLDVWLNVPADELHYVQKILPTLDWAGEHIGVRLRYEPKDVQALKQEYLAGRLAAAAVMDAVPLADEAVAAGSVETPVERFALWPKSMMDFLARRLRACFEVRAYLLDPAKLVAPKDGLASPQLLPEGSAPIDGDPFKNLIRIDEINAQRGFGFVNSSLRGDDTNSDGGSRGGTKLSSQLRAYYSQHLDPFDQPEPKDLDALKALHVAQSAFGKRLATCFSEALKELEDIGYPGVTDPKLTIAAQVRPVDGLNHASAIQYEVPTHLDGGNGYVHRLPEDSNGLGYQNLVSIIFALMGFRDKWVRVGKASKSPETNSAFIPPLHLVLIEEPEAHLHAQVQQVFIKQAYAVLRKHDKLKGSKDHRTQLVVSTHSSHVAHEADFASLRYFRRLPVKAVSGSIPVSCVVNLSEVFGTKGQTERFVRRYLKATHCDLFFADGAVLVEGPAERILVPHFVRKRKQYEYLRRCYITWLEIGGSHAHRLKSLLVHLGLNTLIITDLDAQGSQGKAVPPARGAGHTARNMTLRTWIPKDASLDALLDKKPEELVSSDSSGFSIRVAYQQPVEIDFKSDKPVEVLANTFEDALVYENVDLFKVMDESGLAGQFQKALGDANSVGELAEKLSLALKKGDKAEFAMDLLCSDEIDAIKVPAYIDNGLLWLSSQLKQKEDGMAGKPPPVGSVAATGDAVKDVETAQVAA